jgi:hypothetical protein
MVEAAACYRAANDTDAAEQTAAFAADYQQALERQLRHQQLRLKVALAQADRRVALDAIEKLRALLSEDASSRYFLWLTKLQRELEQDGGEQ